jgi:hypothetical protein
LQIIHFATDNKSRLAQNLSARALDKKIVLEQQPKELCQWRAGDNSFISMQKMLRHVYQTKQSQQ